MNDVIHSTGATTRDWQACLERPADLVLRRIGEEYVVVPVRSRRRDLGEIFTLNRVAGFVLERLDGQTTAAQLVQAVTATFAVDARQATRDLDELLTDFERCGLARVVP